MRPEGFEPPTLDSEDRCSVQLSYGRIHQARPIITPFFRDVYLGVGLKFAFEPVDIPTP